MNKEVLLKILEEEKEIEQELSNPDVLNNREKYKELSLRYKKIKKIADLVREYFDLVENIEVAESLINEGDFSVQKELDEYKKRKVDVERRIKFLLLGGGEGGNAILEIRAGTGGEEAALFAGDLLRMYMKYAEKKGWKFQIVDATKSDLGGFHKVVAYIEGEDAYQRLKYESGVHRVQRVPITESGGRIHTSAASVVVLPEAEEKEVEIKQEDLKIETFRASGPGGQHVNMTESAVRITHIPTGIVVVCQSERSQHKNREKALKILKARLKDYYERQKRQEIEKVRKKFIGRGDRSEKIRTYNFPQNRVTDHRINLTLYNLEEVMEGELDDLIDALAESEEKEKLENII